MFLATEMNAGIKDLARIRISGVGYERVTNGLVQADVRATGDLVVSCDGGHEEVPLQLFENQVLGKCPRTEAEICLTADGKLVKPAERTASSRISTYG